MTSFSHPLFSSPRAAREELLNTLSHGLGVLLSLLGWVLLYLSIFPGANAWQFWGTTIYGLSMFLLYLASTIYHFLPPGESKKLFRILDHSAIFLLIAGTYTPFIFLVFQNTQGWIILAAVWTIAVAGIVLKVFFTGRFRLVSTLLYILMGALILLVIKPFAAVIPHGCFYWILGGAVAYLAGTIFYLWRKLPYSHCIWHIFVLAGSTCHFLALYLYLLPA